MKWYSAYKYKPKHGTQIWLWNQEHHRQELLNAFWDEDRWNPYNWPPRFSRMWAYVFEENEPLLIENK